MAASGLNGFEPGVGGVEEVRRMLPALQRHGLAMRSVYVNSSLHEPAQADRSIDLILGLARELRSEAFDAGDIDYAALAEALVRAKVRPHLVLEIAVEKGTPKTLSPVEAHRRSVAYARRVLGTLG